MKIKKIVAACLAGMMVVGTMAVSAFAAQDTTDLADGTAYLNINNSAWDDFEAEWTNATITGDGDYTVSMTATKAQDLAQFNALEVVNGETVFGYEYVITVTSIKINGTEVKSAEGYTCSADGKGVITRVNLYNEWNSPDAEATAGDDDHLDCRCADGDVTSKTAVMFDSANLTGVTSIEVAFTVSGLSDAETGDASHTAVWVALAAVAVVGAAVTFGLKKKEA